MNRTARFVALAVAGWMATGFAFQRPDFSGRWAADPTTDMGSGWGSTMTIAQSADQLTVEVAAFTRYDMQPPVRFVYALDGSETRNTVLMGRGTQALASRTTWAGPVLGITTVFSYADAISGAPATIEVTHKLALESPTSLVVEVTRGGVDGAKPSTTRTVFKKT